MRRRSALVLVVPALVLAACDTDDGRQLREPTSEQRAAHTTTTSSTMPSVSVPEVVGNVAGTTSTLGPPTSTTLATAFSLQTPWAPGGSIDTRFTCDGENRSPPLTWTAPPVGTVELALLVTDDDAEGFVHWAVAAIPPAAGEVGEGGQITGGIEGRNGFGRPGWGGPCPPSGTHTYRFSLYALNQQAELPEDYTGEELITVASAAAVAVAEVTGTYTRAG